MSIQAVAWALDQDLPARPKLVLVSIANHANHTDGYCWLKAETIAQEAACKPRSVYRFVGDLIRNGFIRKAPKRGDDGRQRANDYWILFNREAAPWVAIGPVDDAADEDDTQDVVPPDDSQSCGEDATPDDSGVLRQPVETHALSHGPTDSGVSHSESAEPSKTNPKDARARPAPPRRYAPPPPEPQGAVIADRQARQIFVYEHSRAGLAWAAYKKRTTGVTWTLWRVTTINGKPRSGWWFPSLFPPDIAEEETEERATDPPNESAA